jgi:hypothetical protein
VSGEGTADTESTGGGAHRVLVVAGDAVADEELRREIGKHLAEADSSVWVVAPAFARTRFKQVAGDVDEGIADAKARLDQTLEELRAAGIAADGTVGDSEPDRAIEDALAIFPADEILLVTHPDDESRWLEDEAFERARRSFEQPVTHIVVEHEGDRERVAEVEEAPAGRREGSGARAQPSRNFPAMSPRDLAGILVAVVGTIALVVLAAACGEGAGLEEGAEGNSGLDGCDARTLIAGAFGLINITHIVGLMLFESLGYRGFWERFFANLSLVGTPLAIVASLLIV